MRRRAAFTLVELLISISVISVLVSLLMPVLGRARSFARSIKCSSQLQQLGAGWQMYGDGHAGYCMPQVWFRASPWIYWWGTYTNPPDYTAGLLAPYVDTTAGADGLFDCPEQPWGSYIPQGASRNPTTTYGYNGLYFCPPHSAWDASVTAAKTHWLTMDQIQTTQVFVFADSLIEWFGSPRNNCLLDGPKVPSGTGWADNRYPTLCFRHLGKACVCFADGHTDSVPMDRGHVTWSPGKVGYAGDGPAPYYVPNWNTWF
jgi:prepilin-type N-terminal cleavage/methylation domain-containing protein/prepilin-type processing-associated H-X9-DG protein